MDEEPKVLIEKADVEAAQSVFESINLDNMPVQPVPKGQRRDDGTDDIFALAYCKNSYATNYTTHILRTGDENNKYYLGTEKNCERYKLVYGNLDRIMVRLHEMFPAPTKDTVLVEEQWNEKHYNDKRLVFNGIVVHKVPQYQGENRRRVMSLAKKLGSVGWNRATIHHNGGMKAPFYVVNNYVVKYDLARQKKEQALANDGKFKHGELQDLIRSVNYTLHDRFPIGENQKGFSNWGFYVGNNWPRATYEQLIEVTGICLMMAMGACPKLGKGVKNWFIEHAAKVRGYVSTHPKDTTALGFVKACRSLGIEVGPGKEAKEKAA